MVEKEKRRFLRIAFIFRLVRETRIELARVAPYAPQTYASTISATPAAFPIIGMTRSERKRKIKNRRAAVGCFL